MTKTHSSSSAKRLQEAGWVVASTATEPGYSEPCEYILEWPHDMEPPYRELSVVEVACLLSEPKDYEGTEAVARAPRVGDVGAIVHCHEFNGRTHFYEVECVGSAGETVWLATFQHAELRQREA